MRTEGSIEIDRPIDEVFRLTSENVSAWSLIVVEDEPIETKPEGVGSTFRTVTMDRGQKMEFEGVVTRFEPPRFHGIEMTGSMFDLEVEYSFEDLGGRTRVTQVSIVHPKGFTKVVLFLFGWAMNKANCRALDKEFQSLKKFCESPSESQSVE